MTQSGGAARDAAGSIAVVPTTEVLVLSDWYCTWSREFISGCTAVSDGARLWSSSAFASSIVSFIVWSNVTPMPRC